MSRCIGLRAGRASRRLGATWRGLSRGKVARGLGRFGMVVGEVVGAGFAELVLLVLLIGLLSVGRRRCLVSRLRLFGGVCLVEVGVVLGVRVGFMACLVDLLKPLGFKLGTSTRLEWAAWASITAAFASLGGTTASGAASWGPDRDNASRGDYYWN